MNGYDFRDEEPVWVRYAEYVGGGSNKFYEVRIDMASGGLYVVTHRWGARPDRGAGQIKTFAANTLTRAQMIALEKFTEKIRKGYRECERPYAAGNKIARERNYDEVE